MPPLDDMIVSRPVPKETHALPKEIEPRGACPKLGLDTHSVHLDVASQDWLLGVLEDHRRQISADIQTQLSQFASQAHPPNPALPVERKSKQTKISSDIDDQAAQECSLRLDSDNKPKQEPRVAAAVVASTDCERQKKNLKSGATEEGLLGGASGEFQCRGSEPAFDEDLASWVSNISESFHMLTFAKEMLGQSAFDLLGPFSLPILLVIYKGRPGLKNRGFLPGLNTNFIVQFLVWVSIVGCLFIFFYLQPDDIAPIEVKLIVIAHFMRVGTIAIKYAYMTTDTWNDLNDKVCDGKYLSSLLIVASWASVPVQIERFYSEMSFIAVLGSAQQRKLMMKFLPWPSETEDLSALQQRGDVSTRRMYHLGQELSKKRKVQRKTFHEMKTSNDLGNVLNVRKSTESNPLAFITAVFAPSCEQEQVKVGNRVTEKAATADESIPLVASAGGSVPIGELFGYIVRAVLRCEESRGPTKLMFLLVFLTDIALVLFPGIMRVRAGKYFLGSSSASAAFFLLSIPTILPLFASLSFVFIAAKDMWRRRALMRCCTALLTVQRGFRKNIMAEMDLLPMLDMSDSTTIEAWRKLRQLCQDWGKVWLNRIQAFTVLFFVCVMAMAGDMIAALEMPSYTHATDVNLTYLGVTGALCLMVFLCLFMIVFFGNEVNQSASTHAFLLQHQSLVISSTVYREMEDPVAESRRVFAYEFLKTLAEDLNYENIAKPLTSLGLYCGYSLLTTMYFIPGAVIQSLARFCSSPETLERCYTYA